MEGAIFDSWERQFRGFLTEAGFNAQHVTADQKLLALEQSVTMDRYNRITALRLSLPTADKKILDFPKV